MTSISIIDVAAVIGGSALLGYGSTSRFSDKARRRCLLVSLTLAAILVLILCTSCIAFEMGRETGQPLIDRQTLTWIQTKSLSGLLCFVVIVLPFCFGGLFRNGRKSRVHDQR